MEMYLLKSVVCLAITFAFYKIFLERESFHVFKRIYLLLALVASFTIPLLTFTVYVEPIIKASETITTQLMSSEIVSPQELPVNYTSIILWSIYGLGFVLFGLRFCYNLFNISEKIYSNPTIKDNKVTHVLLKQEVVPHTFFNFIFFNKKNLETGKIPKEVLLHEQTHATQKHSFDIVVLEIIQVVFWFNPLLYFIKKAIKLNHEFLADQHVLNLGTDPTTYQQIVLAFSSSATPPMLANSINYSSIKKRFTVMKTHTSKRTGLLTRLLILPLLALLVYGFSTTQELIKEETKTTASLENQLATSNQEHITARSISIKTLDNNFIEVEGVKTLKKNLYSTLGTLHTDLTKKQRDNSINIHVSSLHDITYEDLVYIQKIVSAYGYHRIVTPKEEIIRAKGNVPAAPESKITTHNKYAQEYILGAKKNNVKTFVLQIELSELIINGRPVALKDFTKRIDAISKDWEETDYTEAQPSILIASTPKSFLDKVDVAFKKTRYSKANGGIGIIPPPPPSAPKVRKGEKSNIPPPPPPKNLQQKYNQSIILSVNKTEIYLNDKKVAIHYFTEALNNQTKNWTKKDFKLYGLRIDEKNVSEEFKDQINAAYLKSTLAKKTHGTYLIGSLKTKSLNPPPPPPPNTLSPDFTKIPPPPPVVSHNQLDHIVAMAHENAAFFYENQRVSSDRAIELFKNNDNLKIETTRFNKSNPVVKISKNN